MTDLVRDLIYWSDLGVFWYFLFLNSGYAALLIAAIPELWTNVHIADDTDFRDLLGRDALPPVSVLVPAHNEERTIVASTQSFLSLEYPQHEVVLVNDGSRDGTMDALVEAFDLYPVPPAFQAQLPTAEVRAYYRSRRHSKLLVLDKVGGGKADALNAAMNAARFPYVVAVDADTLIEPDALIRLGRPFLLGERVAAVGGTIRVVNGCTVQQGRVTDVRVDRSWLGAIQTVEYLRAFLFGRMGWNRLGGNLVISGAFGMFRREYLMAIGGYQTDNVTEDMDLVVRLHRYLREQGIPGTVPFIPDPVAWTEVPSTVRVLRRQRERWHRGLIGTLGAHKRMLFNRRYGAVGMVAMPFYTFGEMLAPLIELMGLILVPLGLWLGVVNWDFAIAYLAVSMGYGLLLSFWAVLLEASSFRRYRRFSDYALLFLAAMLEYLGYRQLTLFFRVEAFWHYARGKRGWGTMTRKGFSEPAVAK
jgi:cellulose synthase/poly-beta-1,6-N-acetylglucosamine synthase-like glycosyltransferase